MKKKRFLLGGAFIVGMALVVSGCGHTPQPAPADDPAPAPQEQQSDDKQMADTVESTQINAGTYAVQVDRSRLGWEGKKPVATHTGTISLLSGGSIVADDTSFTRGEFEVDMTSMVEDNAGNRLVNHLKSPDFFDATQYPTSKFALTNITFVSGNDFTVMGDLTIKDQTHSIEFPAMITNIENGYNAKATFSIDRTKWGVEFGSGKFFKNLGDNLIDDMITFDLDLFVEKTADAAEEQK